MTRARKQSNSGLGSIRIIGGNHRGRKLPVLNAEGLRPTTDRMKETLFNWLMMDINGAACLDCFAGSGSLGFEAVSRGAKSVYFMELDKQAARQLKSNTELLKCDENDVHVAQGDTLKLLLNVTDSFDIIFIDPPFNQELVLPCINIIQQKGLFKSGAKIYIERELSVSSLPIPSNWRLIKEKSTQQVSAQLYLVD